MATVTPERKEIERWCGYCQQTTPQSMEVEPRPNGLYHAWCGVCGKHNFPPKPENEKVKRPARHLNLVAKYSRGFCEMCLCKKDDLPKGQTLEAQHVVEYQDGGDPKRENIWIVCTGCHKFIHWLRTYHAAPEHPDLVMQVVEATTEFKRQ